jgi:serine/threonine protein kinase
LEEEGIKLILKVSCAEGEVSDDEGEQDDSHGEDVGLLAVIGVAVADFWGHVALSASEGGQLFNVLISGEAEVSELQVHVFVHQNVLELDVSVNNPVGVHIFELFNHLLSKVAAEVFSDISKLLAQVEEEWALDVFHDDVDLVCEGLAIINNHTIIPVIVASNNSLMVEGGKDFDYGDDGVIVYDGQTFTNQVYIVMEYVEGPLLFDLCKQLGNVGEDFGRYFAKQMIEQLEYMYSNGIVHRDIKLENILMDKDMNLKLADFGFATNKHVEELTSFRGTQSYMAPEIRKQEKYNGKQTDIFSMGVVLFTLVVGYFPFSTADLKD